MRGFSELHHAKRIGFAEVPVESDMSTLSGSQAEHACRKFWAAVLPEAQDAL